jgi:adenosylcobinamide-phosphate synthase
VGNLGYAFLLAYGLDLVLGDPAGWPHPVRYLGRVIEFWERLLYRPSVAAGAVFWLAVMGTALGAVWLVLQIMAFFPWFLASLLAAYVIYTGLATRSLAQESRGVEEALEQGDLEEARERLAMIVGRETAHLGPAEIRRAALETVAENLSDGVVAPMFYCLALGLPGLVIYKTANTLDSMVGYKNERYGRFGRVAARLDDFLNYLPARLSGYLMVLAAAFLGLDHGQAWRILRRDARQHSSPNAGWPEAAMAGALGVRVGGPSTYFGVVVAKPYIGDPGLPLGAGHFRRAVRLLYATSLIMAALTFLGLWLSSAGVWGLLGGWRLF